MYPKPVQDLAGEKKTLAKIFIFNKSSSHHRLERG